MTAKKKTSIYEVYSKDAEVRTKRNPLSQLHPKLPKKKFDIIYADPPWDYGGKMQFDKFGKLRTCAGIILRVSGNPMSTPPVCASVVQ